MSTIGNPRSLFRTAVVLFAVAMVYVVARGKPWFGGHQIEPTVAPSQSAHAPTPIKEEQSTGVSSQHDQSPIPAEGEQRTVALTTRAPLSSLGEVQKRVGWSDADVNASDEDYEVSREAFDVFVPATYRSEVPHGLMVWISPDGTGTVPAAYKEVLVQHHVLWAGARNSGNDRKPPVRVNLALDVAAEVSRRYSIDPHRVWVVGMSGGGRSASKAALLYPEVFVGGLFVCGADYVRDIGPSPTGMRWRSSMPAPNPGNLSLAKGNRFFLLTGDMDPNRDEITQIHREYVTDGYPNVQLMVVPGMGHELPSVSAFSQALAWLDSK